MFPALVLQERIVAQRQMSKFLLPGPLVYCGRTDCFITYNSHMEVEAHKYSAVSAMQVRFVAVDAVRLWTSCMARVRWAWPSQARMSLS